MCLSTHACMLSSRYTWVCGTQHSTSIEQVHTGSYFSHTPMYDESCAQGHGSLAIINGVL